MPSNSNELREQLKETRTFNYNVYGGVDAFDKSLSFDEALDELEALILDRERQSRVDELSRIIFNSKGVEEFIIYKYQIDNRIKALQQPNESSELNINEGESDGQAS